MEDFTMAELGVFLGVVGGILTTLILTMQKSKCSEVSLCCLKCKRPVVDLKDKDKELNNNP